MTILQCLEPLSMPWLVSPSVPLVRVEAGEDSISAPTTVSSFGTHMDGSNSRVKLIFRAGLCVRLSLSYSDVEVVRDADYDWSGVLRLSAGPDYEESRRRRRDYWQTTGHCPDPRAYEVKDSVWLNELSSPTALGESLRHYLILGHDAYVEVLAIGWAAEETPQVQTS